MSLKECSDRLFLRKSYGDLGQQNFRLKTNDPEAFDYDEASQTFLDGMKFARQGDYVKAIPYIGRAFLLDDRSVKFTLEPPQNLDPEEKYRVMDSDLLTNLVKHDHGKSSSGVMTIIKAILFISSPRYGQIMIAAAMKVIERLLKNIEENLEEMEGPDSILVHGACLTRTSLLIKRSMLYMALGNRKMAIKDLTKALEIDEFCTKARVNRACVWASNKLKNEKVIHSEFKRIVNESHEDDRGNEVYYAYLALTVLEDSSLGSMEDAISFFEKSMKSTKRTNEIYGERGEDRLPSILKVVEAKFKQCPKERQKEKDFIDDIKKLNKLGIRIVKDKYICIACGSREGENQKTLLVCARCKKVHYCSKECQVRDWKSHKSFCKTISKGN